MPTFAYKARDEIGKAVVGSMEADSEDELINKLRKLSYMPVHVSQTLQKTAEPDKSPRRLSQKIKTEDMVIFNMQLAGMIDAGITLLGALNIITKQIVNERFRHVIEKVKQDVAAGASLSEALSSHPQIFTSLYVSMVRAGETAGALNTILNRLADHIEKEEELKRKIKGALFYPVILLAVGLLVILLIVTFVMPNFVAIFNKADIALPLPTQILYGFGLALKKFWYFIILGLCAGIIGARAYARSLKGRLTLDQWKLKIPAIGPVVRKIIVARFSRTLATLVDSGVSILQSLDIMTGVVHNEVFARVVRQARKSIERGERLDQPLKMSKEFPDDAVHMISVGEETGKLGQMLHKVADFYEASVEYQIRRLTTLIEPVFIIIMGIMVGFIMASMLIPIFDMVKSIQA